MSRVSAVLYSILISLFTLFVLLQVFFAGLAVFYTPVYWTWHITLVHVFEWIPLFLIVFSLLGRMSAWARLSSIGLFLLLIGQYVTANTREVPFISALHPVNALMIFLIAILATYSSWREVLGGDQ